MRIRAALIVLMTLLVSVVTSPVAAHAVSECGTSGQLGNPLLVSYQGRSPNTVRIGMHGYNYIHGGQPEYYCPTGVFVHARYDLAVICENGNVTVMRRWGWHRMGKSCAKLGGSSRIWIYEYRT